MKKDYTEEDLRQAFYKGREQASLPDGKVFFLRQTFNGYLRELDGQEDPHKLWEERLKSYKEKPVDPATCNHSYKSMHRMQSVRTQYQCTICKHITEL